MIQSPVTIPDDGIRLSAVLERPDGQPRPLVIVLHGFTSAKNRPHTLTACEAMREAGFSTLRMDLYGHGDSDGEFCNHTLAKWISNTMATIDWARRQDFVTGVWLSGHSQGGLTAALAAGMEPDHVRGLILRAPAFMIPRCAREGNLLGFAFDPLHVPDEIRVIKDLALNGNYIRVAQTVYAEEAARRFPGRVLILHGEEDDVVPPSESAEVAGLYRHCRLEMIPDETHHFDRHPERMREIIRDWLEQVGIHPDEETDAAPAGESYRQMDGE